MSSSMVYKGYNAKIEYDDEDKILFGRITGIRDIVSFHGTSVAEVEAAFHESVNDYVAACAELGQTPEKPASGKFMLRLPPEVHSAAIAAAQASGKSLNQWAGNLLREAVTR
jgi:predicted HicB family RNase H-like nuclease